MMRVFTLIAFLLHAVLLCASSGVDDQVSFEPLSSDLLPSNYVKSIYQDREGFIWIAANNGLVRYDGKDAVSYSVYIDKYSFIYEIIEDNDGMLLLATDKGLVRMDRVSGQTEAVIEGYPISSVVRDPDGNFWAGGEKGIFCMQSGHTEFSEVEIYVQDNKVQGIIDLMATDDGCIWMTTWRKGLYVYEPSSEIIRVYDSDLLAYSYVLHQDSEGRVWTGTWGYGLLLLDADFLTTASYTSYPTVSEDGSMLIDEVIYALNDLSGFLLIGGQKGLALMEIEDEKFDFYAPGPGRDSLPYNQVNSILVTDNANIYLGLYGGGMCLMDYKATPYEYNPLENVRKQFGTNTVNSIGEADKGRLWLGIPDNGFGLYDIGTRSFTKYDGISHFSDVLSISTVFSIKRRTDSEQMCFGTYSEGLWVYNHKHGKVKVFSSETCSNMVNHNVLAMENDLSGNLWVGTNAGVYVLNQADTLFSMHEFLGLEDEAFNDQVHGISVGSDSTIYLATTYNGIVEANPSTSSIIRHTCEEKMVSFVNVLIDKTGNIWAGASNDGLYILDKTDGFMKKSNPVLDMESENITNLLQLPDDRILITSSEEVLIFSYSSGQISGLTYISDLGLDFRQNAHLLKDEVLYFGTTNGLFKLSLSDCAPHTYTGNVAITDFIVNGQSYRELGLSDNDINYIDQIKVRRGDNVKIRFTVLDYNDFQSPVFSYVCDGIRGKTVEGEISFTVSQSKTSVEIYHDISSQGRKMVVVASYDKVLLYLLLILLLVIGLIAAIVWMYHKQKTKNKDVMAFEINSIKFQSPDQEFLQKAMEIVDRHISDADFMQEDFIKEMGISRTILTDKLKELTGYTPISLILEVRLKTAYASIMASEGKLRVSDVAYSVGFNDAKYFSTCFRKKYGITPKDLMKKRLEELAAGSDS